MAGCSLSAIFPIPNRLLRILCYIAHPGHVATAREGTHAAVDSAVLVMSVNSGDFSRSRTQGDLEKGFLPDRTKWEVPRIVCVSSLQKENILGASPQRQHVQTVDSCVSDCQACSLCLCWGTKATPLELAGTSWEASPDVTQDSPQQPVLVQTPPIPAALG